MVNLSVCPAIPPISLLIVVGVGRLQYFIVRFLSRFFHDFFDISTFRGQCPVKGGGENLADRRIFRDIGTAFTCGNIAGVSLQGWKLLEGFREEVTLAEGFSTTKDEFLADRLPCRNGRNISVHQCLPACPRPRGIF